MISSLFPREFFLVLKMKDFLYFVPHHWILVFDSEQVYLKLQVTHLKNKENTKNPKPQTLKKNKHHQYKFALNPKP